MVRRTPLLSLAVAYACTVGPADDGDLCWDSGKCDSAARAGNHVQLIHVDGFRPDVFRALLDGGQLPHFRILADRGKVSYQAATVDKSETMKVVQSYLTSRNDTEVTAWWQFSRADFQFRNFWIDAAEVANFALGLEFPLRPTIEDYLADKGKTLTASMSLARRGVPFENYGRAYIEGFQAVSSHEYFRQAEATTTQQLDILKRIATEPGKLPSLSHLLLAPADEFAHAQGVASEDGRDEYCFTNDRIHAPIFELLASDAASGGHLAKLVDKYFSRNRTDGGALAELCIRLPEITVHRDQSATATSTIGPESRVRVAPRYALGMIMVDLQLGRLIDTLRGIRMTKNGEHRYEDPPDLLDYIAKGKPEGSLYEKTMFIIFGDHGMMDTPYFMAPVDTANPDTHRAAGSLDVSFLEYIDRGLGLSTVASGDVAADARIGVNYEVLPERLSVPHRFKAWQSPQISALTDEARAFAASFFTDANNAVNSPAVAQHWWLQMLKSMLVDPRAQTIAEVEAKAIDTMAELYLRGEPAYLEALAAGNRAFYDEHVRMVYGGGALNNAELFLPVCDAAGRCSWATRPSLDQVLGYRGVNGQNLLELVKANPGVGLIFVREGNEQIAQDKPLPSSMRIRVMDRFGNQGTITVTKYGDELKFRYQVAASSPADPLGVGSLGKGNGTELTYREWNDRGVDGNFYYPNVIGGIGTYLYSSNPATGDLVLMHAQGWNFGNNAGGHGGVHREEKLTMMLVSAPGMAPGELHATGGASPSLLDVAPTALSWLGESKSQFAQFAKTRFASYLADWSSRQRGDILGQLGGVDQLRQALADAGFDTPHIDAFRERLIRLLKFIGAAQPRLPVQDGVMEGRPLNIEGL
jgi:hypothetical protein